MLRAAPLLLLLFPVSARAYRREEHYETLRLVLDAAKVPDADAGLVAACAQLPDEASELSAVDIYRRLMRHPLDFASWAALKRGPVATAGRMLTMQQLLHGITGGSSDRMAETSRLVVDDLRPALSSKAAGRADALCALGFAFHLYGDAHAHRMLKNPAKMYETGLGHFFDSAKPDFPLYSPSRAGAWREFVLGAGGAIGADEKRLKTLADEADELQRGAGPSNGWRERELVALAAKGMRPHAPFDPSLRRSGCAAIVARQSRLDGFPAPDCDRAWSLFRDAAIRRFDAAEAEKGAEPLRGEPFKKLTYFVASPFSKGASW